MLGASSTSMPSGLVVAIVALGRLAVDQHRQAFLEAEAVAVGEALLLLSLVARSCAPMASSPRINTPDKRCPTPQLKKPVSGHHPSACSGVKALRKHKRR
jgi:hypothetical protein